MRPNRVTRRSNEAGANAARGFSSATRHASTAPASAIAAATALCSGAREAIAVWSSQLPEATTSTSSASIRSGERASTRAAMSAWSEASAWMTA
jgi:hypothetical protein